MRLITLSSILEIAQDISGGIAEMACFPSFVERRGKTLEIFYKKINF